MTNFLFLVTTFVYLNAPICKAPKFNIKVDNKEYNNSDNKYKLFLETEKELIKFSESNSLLIPKETPNNINSIFLVIDNTDTLSFFNYKKNISKGFPKDLAKTLSPMYESVFKDKRDLNLIIDSSPYENESIKKFIKENPTNNGKTIFSMYYQVTNIFAYPLN